jgi:hypothetical protein
MSMELYVLSDRQLTSVSQWQSAIDAEGFVLHLPSSLPLEGWEGIISCQLGDNRTGFECRNLRFNDFKAEVLGARLSQAWNNALVLRWGADPYASAAAYMAAAAYARATEGAIFDGEEGEFLSMDRAVEVAREIEAGIPIIIDAVDRMLKKMKSDLK